MPFDVGGTEVTTGASIGIALGQTGPASPEDLMRNADLALYDAKNAGKNRYAVFAPTMHEAALARLSLTSDLRHAIERDELVVHYQPLVDLESGRRSSGLEALVRWEHPELGLMQPGQFIALAEETGLIVPLGRMVLGQALRDTVRGSASTTATPSCTSRSTSAAGSCRTRASSTTSGSRSRASGIDPGTVVLEITESVLLPGDGVIVERLHALAALGVHLYIDDFGTGYSSLSYLQMLPVNGLKLAQEFVEALPGTDTESGLVRTIRDLAGTLGLPPWSPRASSARSSGARCCRWATASARASTSRCRCRPTGSPTFLSGLSGRARATGSDAPRRRRRPRSRHPVRREPSPTDPAGRRRR